jgi:hypothetical protein
MIKEMEQRKTKPKVIKKHQHPMSAFAWTYLSVVFAVSLSRNYCDPSALNTHWR